MSTAQVGIYTDDELVDGRAQPLPPFALTQPALSEPALKQQVADRLAAHRARRGHADSTPMLAADQKPAASRVARTRSANIAAAVAERYAHSPSYRAFLAAEAERAVQKAEAAAQVATISAKAIAIAQQQLLSDLEDWDSSTHKPISCGAIPNVPLSAHDFAALFHREPASPPTALQENTAPATQGLEQTREVTVDPRSFTVRHYEDADHRSAAAQRNLHAAETRLNAAQPGPEFDEDERFSLDEEIAFRQNPIFEEPFQQEPIAANLIEFPRQLVAPRKARPRLAEGPLRDGNASADAPPQLRIFEVEPGQISSAPANEALPPEWSSILLSALPRSEFTPSADAEYLQTGIPQAAPISLRLMAALVDTCYIVTVQAAFTAIFVLALTRLSGQQAALEIPRAVAIAGTALTLPVLAILYQLLFFTLSDATPGMRYARIGLCTFSDENPTRSAMRGRIFSTLLAAFPIGLGLVWAFLDEDTLGWHDRISHMYQRAY